MRSVLRTVCLLLAACLPLAATQAMPTDPAQQQAIDTARTTLAGHTGIPAEHIELLQVHAQTWPDASLGCPQPDQMYAQVVTEGHVVVLKAGNRSYPVHVASGHAVVCESMPGTPRPARREYAISRASLEAMEIQARQDLAGKLGIEPRAVHQIFTEQHDWPDQRLGCPHLDEPEQAQPARGFVIGLEVDARLYRYHTDLERVFACPPIEME